MRMQRQVVAVAAAVVSLASGGGVAWACTGGHDPGYTGTRHHRNHHYDDDIDDRHHDRGDHRGDAALGRSGAHSALAPPRPARLAASVGRSRPGGSSLAGCRSRCSDAGLRRLRRRTNAGRRSSTAEPMQTSSGHSSPIKPSSAADSDERLVELTRAGSDRAFEAIVRRHRQALVRHCASLVGDHDAQEAAQDAVLKAHRALLAGAEVQRLGPWLHAIARNAALQLLRSHPNGGAVIEQHERGIAYRHRPRATATRTAARPGRCGPVAPSPPASSDRHARARGSKLRGNRLAARREPRRGAPVGSSLGDGAAS